MRKLSKKGLTELITKAVDTAFDAKVRALNEKRGGMVGVGGAPGDSLGDHNTPPVPGDWKGPSITANKSKDRRGLALARVIQCRGAALLWQKEHGEIVTPLQFAKKFYADDDMVTKALSIGDFTSGGAFGMQELSSEVIEFLRPRAVMTQTGIETMQMRTGAIRISKLTRGSQGSYVGENQLGGITEPNTGDVEMSAKKLKAEIPSSNDLFRFAVVNADAVIRNDLVRALSQRMDAALIRDDGTTFTPRGLRFIVPAANVIPAGANTLTGIEATLGNLELALRSNDVPMDGVWWLMSPRTERRLKTIRTGVNENYAYRDEMRGGTLNGFRYAVTTQIPENLGGGADTELYLFASPLFVLGEAMDMEIMTSLEAAYFDGTALRSAFSRDQMVVRAIMQHDFAARYDFAVAVSGDVNWPVV